MLRNPFLALLCFFLAIFISPATRFIYVDRGDSSSGDVGSDSRLGPCSCE